MKWIFVFGIAALGVCAWLAAPKIYDVFLHFYALGDDAELAKRGQFGDSFGALTSLFSFLSFIGVIAVLVLSQYHDGEKERPFVLTGIDDNEVPMKILVQNADQGYQIEARLTAKNHSNHLAHSLRIKAWMECDNEKVDLTDTYIHRPITINPEAIKISKSVAIKDTGKLLDSLSADRDIKLIIFLSYKNTSNHKFSSENRYSVRLNAGDHEAINSLRRKEIDDKIWGGGKFVTCQILELDDFVS